MGNSAANDIDVGLEFGSERHHIIAVEGASNEVLVRAAEGVIDIVFPNSFNSLESATASSSNLFSSIVTASGNSSGFTILTVAHEARNKQKTTVKIFFNGFSLICLNHICF
mgnify:CR=1 FL=1